MASRFSLEAVFRAVDKFSSPMKKITSSTNKFTSSLKKDFAKAQRQVANFGQNLKRHAWIGATAVIAGIAYMVKEGVQLASDLYEVQNVVDTTFRESSKVIDKWSQSAISDFGLSELQAKKFTGSLGAALKSSGITGDEIVNLSTDLVGLSGDFASFYNLPVEEAFEKIRSGIMGQSKPLRDLGINMSVANLEAYALSKGMQKQFKDMSQGEQTMLRYNYLMSVSNDAQGDFAKTLSTSLANQTRVLQTKFSQKLAGAMQKLIPILIKVMEGFNNFLDTLDTDAIANFVVIVFNGIKKGIDIFISFIKFLKPFAPIIFGIVAAFAAYKAIMILAAIAQGILNIVMLANPIGLLIIAIGVLIGLTIIIVQNWDKITGALKKGWNAIKKTGKALWDNLIKGLQKAGDWISKNFDKFSLLLGPIGFLVSIVQELGKSWDDITNLFKKGDILGGILAIGRAMLSGLLAPIQGFLELVSNIPGLGDIAKGAAEKIRQIREGLTEFEIKKPEGEGKEVSVAPITQGERSATIMSEEKTTGELIIKDETGRALLSKGKGNKKPGYKIRLQTSSSFTGAS